MIRLSKGCTGSFALKAGSVQFNLYHQSSRGENLDLPEFFNTLLDKSFSSHYPPEGISRIVGQ